MTVYEAANLWVTRDMTIIPYNVIRKLKEYDCDDIIEITPPSINDRVYINRISYDKSHYGEIIDMIKSENGDYIYIVKTDDDEEISVNINELEVINSEYLPMWGTLWSFEDMLDINWLENNLQTMANCGFRIYESEDYGYIFGIDGAGYDFYESHWIPLYQARGLKWHDKEE